MFRLENQIYHVGEPIVVDFTVVNTGTAAFSFFEGGDYRGGLRHEQFSFKVDNAAGRVFTTGPSGSLGGIGRLITLEPDESFRCWQLLNPWFHFLPPGDYTIHCERTLAPYDEAESGTSFDVKQDLSITVMVYSKRAILERLTAMEEMDVSESGAKRLFGVPLRWAIADLGEKFSIEVPASGGRSRVRAVVQNALPETWDERLYVAYDLTANRNWLSPSRREEFVLTLVAKNHGGAPIPHRLSESSLSVNGVALSGWADMVRARMEERQISDYLAAGATAEIKIKLNEFLPRATQSECRWNLDQVSRQVRVRIGK